MSLTEWFGKGKKGNPTQDKFLAKHMRSEYAKNPDMSDKERDRQLAIAYSKYERG